MNTRDVGGYVYLLVATREYESDSLIGTFTSEKEAKRVCDLFTKNLKDLNQARAGKQKDKTKYLVRIEEVDRLEGAEIISQSNLQAWKQGENWYYFVETATAVGLSAVEPEARFRRDNPEEIRATGVSQQELVDALVRKLLHEEVKIDHILEVEKIGGRFYPKNNAVS